MLFSEMKVVIGQEKMSSVNIYVLIVMAYNCFSEIVLGFVQVDPLTHQVKLCDFGSAKMLVCLPVIVII